MTSSASGRGQRTHYQVLGVAPSASSAQIRKAWVAQARKHHPDLNAGPLRERAEVAMREVNEAWHVLGDASRRQRYDQDLLTGDSRSSSNFNRPSHDGAQYGGWKPYSSDDDDEVDPRLLSNARVGGKKELSRAITLLPIYGFVIGVLVFFFGLLLASRGVLALGGVIIASAAAGFVIMPLLVMSRAERDPNL